jgi:hypothetical protein
LIGTRVSDLSALRSFVRPRESAARESSERCDRCGVSLPTAHIHQFDPATRRIRCACDVCACSQDDWLKIPRIIRTLENFHLIDSQWDELMIPISLAFFSFSTPAGKIVAFYPGPAGAAESMMPLDIWQEIAETNPALQLMKPDVEALLVNRVGAAREYFLVPVDECYKLVGIIRIHWRGLSGGAMVWGEITRFFDELRRRSEPLSELLCNA